MIRYIITKKRRKDCKLFFPSLKKIKKCFVACTAKNLINVSNSKAQPHKGHIYIYTHKIIRRDQDLFCFNQPSKNNVTGNYSVPVRKKLLLVTRYISTRHRRMTGNLSFFPPSRNSTTENIFLLVLKKSCASLSRT